VGTSIPIELVDGAGPGRSKPAQPTNTSRGTHPSAPLVLSEDEARVLETLSQPHRLTFSQLMRATAQEEEQLRLALGGLRTKGLIVRLETVIESYSCHIVCPGAPIPRDEGQTLHLAAPRDRPILTEKIRVPYGPLGSVLGALARSKSKGHIKEILARLKALAEAMSAARNGNTPLQT
jgi:hypothetical protein